MIPLLVLIPFSYLLGSISFALILARAHGIDIRSVGSGNVGATNLSRALGRKWGYVCFFLDVSKGLVPMLIARALITNITLAALWLWLAVGCAAIVGHVFPFYLGFRGGKGVATSLGVVLGLFPYYTLPGLAAFVLWILCVLIWRYISLASILAAALFPLVLFTLIAVLPSWRFPDLWPLTVVAVIMPALVILRHRENIGRLLRGTENKVFTQKTNE